MKNTAKVNIVSGGVVEIENDGVINSFGTLELENSTTTIVTDSSSFTIGEPQYLDQHILSYEICENKKSITITVKQVINNIMNGGTWVSVTPQHYDEERVVRRTYKVKNGKLKLHKEEIGRIIPAQSLPERYEFNQ